ncbi:MAG: hypothetical protein QXM93_06165 [Candidatus Methanomethyliaceae archaeon]
MDSKGRIRHHFYAHALRKYKVVGFFEWDPRAPSRDLHGPQGMDLAGDPLPDVGSANPEVVKRLLIESAKPSLS